MNRVAEMATGPREDAPEVRIGDRLLEKLRGTSADVRADTLDRLVRDGILSEADRMAIEATRDGVSGERSVRMAGVVGDRLGARSFMRRGLHGHAGQGAPVHPVLQAAFDKRYRELAGGGIEAPIKFDPLPEFGSGPPVSSKAAPKSAAIVADVAADGARSGLVADVLYRLPHLLR